MTEKIQRNNERWGSAIEQTARPSLRVNTAAIEAVGGDTPRLWCFCAEGEESRRSIRRDVGFARKRHVWAVNDERPAVSVGLPSPPSRDLPSEPA
jgi:hypothetical protein